MFSYVVRRLLYSIPILLGVLVLTFVLFRVNQDERTIAILAKGEKAPKQVIDEFIKNQGLDKPKPQQLVNFVWNAVTLNFGESWRTGRSVTEIFRTGVLPSLLITIPGFAAGVISALGLALYQVFVRNSPMDRTLTIFCVALMSIPSIVYIIFCQAVLALAFNYFPASGFDWQGLGTLRFLILPIGIMAIVNLGYDGRLFRAVFLEEIAHDYVRTAQAKGVPNTVILTRHVLKNGLIAIITLTVGQLPKLVMGALLIESFFGIPGLGNVLVLAIQQGDQPVVMASVFLGAVLYLFALILTDILYAVADPRIRLS